MAIHPLKKYEAFMKLTLGFQNDCRKTEKEIEAFTDSIEVFQKKVDGWQKMQYELLNTPNPMIPVNAQQLLDVLKKATELSLAMGAFYVQMKAYQSNVKKFLAEFNATMANRTAEQVMAELPKTERFVKKQQPILAAEMAELKKATLPLKTLRDELEALYKMTYN